MGKNRTRRNRNKTEGGKRRNRNKTEGGASTCGMKLSGGKRKGTRKLSKGASDWNKSVMKVYAEMKKKDKDTKFGDALKEASKRKKAGTL
jgi:hypothetical protein